jgi:hypothetical protein
MVRRMLAGLPRVNCWTLAEHAGHGRPDQLQHLLAAAVWDEDGVRDELRGDVVTHVAGADPADVSGTQIVQDHSERRHTSC